MEQRLYKAALEGSVTSLHELLGEDPLVLDRVTLNCFNETPLHVAAMRGHLDFVKEIVARNPELAGELDSRGLSPLHWASAKGQLEIVKTLLSVKPAMCSARDQDGRNPLHLAAIKGQVCVLEELLQAKPDAARAIVSDKGATILHLCVQHNQLDVLKLLLETINDRELANLEDEHGNTILDLAIADKKIATIKYLVSSAKIDVNATNANRLAALDNILAPYMKDLEIGDSRGEAGELSGRDRRTSRMTKFLNALLDPPGPDFVKEIRTGLMVVASVMVTLTFQIGVNPPGGFWQEDHLVVDGKPVPIPHKAGQAIMPYLSPNSYAFFDAVNTLNFVFSMLAMLFLSAPIPLRNDSLVVSIFGYMLSTCITVALTYFVSTKAITPDVIKQPQLRPTNKARTCLAMGCAVTSPLIIVFAIIKVRQWWRRKSRQLERPNSSSGDLNHAANRDQKDRQNIQDLT